MKKQLEKLNEIHELMESHLNENVVDSILKIFTGEKFNKSIEKTLSSSNILFTSYKCGFAELPNVDNFFFPQEIYVNLQEYTLPVEALPGLLPSVDIRKCTDNFLYSKIKLAKIDVEYTPSSVFMAASSKLKEIITENQINAKPRYVCFLYYPQIVNDDLLLTKNFLDEEAAIVKSMRYHLWLYFPVSKTAEEKYLNEVKHKIKYPDLQADLTIRISVTYDLTYEEIAV